MTGDVFEDGKYYNDGAQHIDPIERLNLFSEHVRLFYGGKKEEDEDEEEYY